MMAVLLTAATLVGVLVVWGAATLCLARLASLLSAGTVLVDDHFEHHAHAQYHAKCGLCRYERQHLPRDDQ